MSDLLNEVQGSIVTDQVSNVTTSFTSWDKCMLQSYCKWPVIFGIAIGGIVALSIIICITRCLCCGYSFCCSCFSFLSCCGSCGGCCDGRRKKRSDKYITDLSSANINQGYSAPPPMMKGGFNKSQFARFSTNKANFRPLNEDALPAMPSWDTATSVHVLDDSEESKGTELNQINSSTGSKVPLLTAAATSGRNSPLNQGNDLTPFQTRSLSNNNNGFVNPNDSVQRRVLENPISQYPVNPYTENLIRKNGPRYGDPSSPLSGRGYGPPLQSPYLDSGRSTPVQALYPEDGRSTHPYNHTRFGSPIPGGRTQSPIPGGRTQVPIPGGRTQSPIPGGRTQVPIPGGRTQVREYGQPPQIQRPEMGYQGYRA